MATKTKTTTTPQSAYSDTAKIKRGTHIDQATGVHALMVELLPQKLPVTIKAFMATCGKSLEQKNAHDKARLIGYLKFQVRKGWVKLV